MYVIDTNIIVDFLRGKLPIGLASLKASEPKNFGIPAIVEAELLFGALRSGNPGATLEATRRMIEPFQRLPFDSACAQRYAEIREHLQSNGLLIGPNDMLIAATALANNATLVTNNVNEFKRIPGLSLESWVETSLP